MSPARGSGAGLLVVGCEGGSRTEVRVEDRAPSWGPTSAVSPARGSVAGLREVGCEGGLQNGGSGPEPGSRDPVSSPARCTISGLGWSRERDPGIKRKKGGRMDDEKKRKGGERGKKKKKKRSHENSSD